MSNILYQYGFDMGKYIVEVGPAYVVGIGFMLLYCMTDEEEMGITSRIGHTIYLIICGIAFFGGLFLLIAGIKITAQSIEEDLYYKNCLKTNKYEVAEGYVEQFYAMSRDGHDSDHFVLDGVYFSYSPYVIKKGYTTPAYEGGVIRNNGQHLRIKYVPKENTYYEKDKWKVILEIEELP